MEPVELGNVLYLQTILLWIAATASIIAAINSTLEGFAYKGMAFALCGFISVIWYFRYKIRYKR